MTTNDVSCRDMQVRPDRPGLRSDWLGGKSHDNFAPMGPFLVPRVFVPNHMNLFIRLTVNGEVKQNGNTSQFIFTPEEQIEYASNILSIETGDIFSCGTCGGVGQGTNTFSQSGRCHGDRDREPRQNAKSFRRRNRIGRTRPLRDATKPNPHVPRWADASPAWPAGFGNRYACAVR